MVYKGLSCFNNEIIKFELIDCQAFHGFSYTMRGKADFPF